MNEDVWEVIQTVKVHDPDTEARDGYVEYLISEFVKALIEDTP